MTSSALAGYPVATGSLGPAITCGTTTTLAASGTLRSISAADASEYGAAFTPRVLDSAVVSALSRWVFEEGPYGRSVEVEVEFKRSNPRPQ